MRELEKNQRFGMWEGRWERAVSAPFGKDGIGVRHNSTPWTTLHKIPKSFSHVGQQKVGSQLEPMSQKEDKNSHDITGQGIWASSPSSSSSLPSPWLFSTSQITTLTT